MQPWPLPLLLLLSLSPLSLSAMVGNRRPLTPEQLRSASFRGAVDAAALAANRASNSARFHAVANVREATRQVVAGILYEFVAFFAATECENREHLLLDNVAGCRAPDGADAEYRCTFRVVHQPWRPQAEYSVLDRWTCQQLM